MSLQCQKIKKEAVVLSHYQLRTPFSLFFTPSTAANLHTEHPGEEHHILMTRLQYCRTPKRHFVTFVSMNSFFRHIKISQTSLLEFSSEPAGAPDRAVGSTFNTERAALQADSFIYLMGTLSRKIRAEAQMLQRMDEILWNFSPHNLRNFLLYHLGCFRLILWKKSVLNIRTFESRFLYASVSTVL